MIKLFEKQQKLLAKLDKVLLTSEAVSSTDLIWNQLRCKQNAICEVEKVTPLILHKTNPNTIPKDYIVTYIFPINTYSLINSHHLSTRCKYI